MSTARYFKRMRAHYQEPRMGANGRRDTCYWGGEMAAEKRARHAGEWDQERKQQFEERWAVFRDERVVLNR